jgi:hypothetical protein
MGDGDALIELKVVTNGFGPSAGLKDWMTGVGRRGLRVLL